MDGARQEEAGVGDGVLGSAEGLGSGLGVRAISTCSGCSKLPLGFVQLGLGVGKGSGVRTGRLIDCLIDSLFD